MTALRFRTIAFDLDGTIADTAPDLAAALNHTLAFLGRPTIAPSDVRGMIGHGVRALLRNGLVATGRADEAALEAGLPELMRFYEAHICVLTVPYPGVTEAFDALADRGVALALCTNKTEHLAFRLIEALGWRERFAAIIGGDTAATTKPDPAMLHLAIERAGGGPAAMIGDSIVDVQTARAAGVPCIAVSFGFADRPADQLGADAVIDGYGVLLRTLGLL
jgi:phosphoglycolate phosphatase